MENENRQLETIHSEINAELKRIHGMYNECKTGTMVIMTSFPDKSKKGLLNSFGISGTNSDIVKLILDCLAQDKELFSEFAVEFLDGLAQIKMMMETQNNEPKH